MADQSVRITNLDHGSPTRVAYDLWTTLRLNLTDKSGKAEIDQQLTLFEACRRAAHGSTYDLSKFT